MARAGMTTFIRICARWICSTSFSFPVRESIFYGRLQCYGISITPTLPLKVRYSVHQTESDRSTGYVVFVLFPF